MSDSTNAGVPSNNPQLSGDATKIAAINRLRKLQEKGAGKITMTPGGPPSGPPGGPPRGPG
jgi:hypothetical protein